MNQGENTSDSNLQSKQGTLPPLQPSLHKCEDTIAFSSDLNQKIDSHSPQRLLYNEYLSPPLVQKTINQNHLKLNRLRSREQNSPVNMLEDEIDKDRSPDCSINKLQRDSPSKSVSLSYVSPRRIGQSTFHSSYYGGDEGLGLLKMTSIDSNLVNPIFDNKRFSFDLLSSPLETPKTRLEVCSKLIKRRDTPNGERLQKIKEQYYNPARMIITSGMTAKQDYITTEQDKIEAAEETKEVSKRDSLTPKSHLNFDLSSHSGFDIQTKKTDNYLLSNKSLGERNNTVASQQPESPLHVANELNVDLSSLVQPANEAQAGNSVQIESTGNRQMIQQQQLPPNESQLGHTEAKLFIFSSIALFAAIAISSLFVLIMANKHASYRGLSIVIYSYLVYSVAENLVKGLLIQREQWRAIESLFGSLDYVGILFFVVCLDLELSKVVSINLLSFIPLLLVNLAYCSCSKAPQTLKIKTFLSRCLFTIQIFLIGVNINGTAKMSWNVTFLISWVYFSIVLLYFLVYTVSLFKLFSIFSWVSAERNSLIALCGLFWSVAYYGFSINAYIVLVGIDKAYSSLNRFDALNIAAIVGLCMGAFMICYTALIYRNLVEYLYMMRFQSDVIFDETQGAGTQKETVDLVQEYKECYFKKLSSTYFQYLDRDLFKKNSEDLQMVKEELEQVRSRERKFSNIHKPKLVYKSKLDTIQTLKDFKMILSQGFDKLSREIQNRTQDQRRNKASKLPEDNIEIAHSVVDLPVSTRERQIYPKRFSLNDIDNIKEIHKDRAENQKLSNDENLCYLCYERVADVVLMNCGHGGICFNCVVPIVKKNYHCMECRGHVKTIYKIQPSSQSSGIVKSYEHFVVKIDSNE